MVFQAAEGRGASAHPRAFEDVSGGETLTTVAFGEPGRYRLMAGNGLGRRRSVPPAMAHVDFAVR